MNARDHAVLIGVTRYPALGNLSGPENDVELFREWLLATDGGALPAKNVHVVCSSAYAPTETALGAQPHAADVDSALERIIEAVGLAETGGGRRLYCFMAGHGFGPTVDESALLLANATERGLGHHVPGIGFMTWFREAALFEEIVLLMDCCRDIVVSHHVRLPPWESLKRPEGGETKLVVGLAAKWGRAARERSVGVDGQMQGLFTTAIVDGLRHAVDPDGRVTVPSLRDYVHQRMGEMATEHGLADFEPSFRFEQATGADPVVVFRDAPGGGGGMKRLTRRALPTVPVSVRFRRSPSPAATVYDASLAVLGTVDAGAGERWDLELVPNRQYLIVETDAEGASGAEHPLLVLRAGEYVV